MLFLFYFMDFTANSFNIFDRDWALLTAGTPEHFNSMTISWGGLGTLWGKPVVTVYVKPIRYTHQFMDSSEYFTISFYEDKYRKALGLMGTLSGRDCNKIEQAGLKPEPFDKSVTFQEAKVTFLCKKIYRQDLNTAAMPTEVVNDYYKNEDPHTMYIGEVLKIEQ